MDLREENEKIREIDNMRLGVSFLIFVENNKFSNSIRGTTKIFLREMIQYILQWNLLILK